MRRLTPLAMVLVLGFASELSAQTSDERAFIALRETPVGALTPLITPAMISRRLNGAQLGLRYGFREEFGVQTQSLAASGVFGVGLSSSVAVTAGVGDSDCFNCSPALMLGLGGDMRVYEAGGSAGSPTLSIAISGDLGYAQLPAGDESAFGFGVGAPVTLSFGAAPEQGGLRFAPFMTPVFGIGSTSHGCVVPFEVCEETGTRWMLGGGVGVWNPLSSISASLGINHVFFEGSRPVFGVNVQIGGK